MNTFRFKRRNLISGPHLLGSLLIMAGLVVLISPVFFSTEDPLGRVFAVGVGAILLGLVIVSSYRGTLIDFSRKRTKDYYSICGFKFGDWTALPDILTVEVISAHKRISNTPNGISPTLSGKVIEFQTLLYSTAFQPHLSFVYTNRREAVKQAGRLAAGLNANMVLRIPERS